MRRRKLLQLFILLQGIQLAKFGLLIDKSSSLYLKMRLKVLVSVILLFLYKLFLIGVKENIGEESYSTVSYLQNEMIY